MKIIEGETIQKACKNLQQIARYKPYEYRGTWFAFRFDKINYFYRNKNSAFNKLNNLAGLNAIDYDLFSVKI